MCIPEQHLALKNPFPPTVLFERGRHLPNEGFKPSQLLAPREFRAHVITTVEAGKLGLPGQRWHLHYPSCLLVQVDANGNIH